MISKKDIIEIAHPDVKGTKVIELSTLSELRQQLKDKLTKLSKTQSIYENVTWAEIDEIIDGVMCVEGETNASEI